MPGCLALMLLLTPFLVVSAHAQQSERFGVYEIHHSVVNTTFLAPQVSERHGIVRGKNRAILNLAVREHLANGTSVARSAKVEGRTWDLFQNQFFEFKEIREGEAIYYIAEFSFINEEWRFFEMDFRPDGAEQSYTFKFKHQLYIN